MLNDSFSEELGLEDQISKIVDTLMDDSFEEEKYKNEELPTNGEFEVEPNGEQHLQNGLDSEKVVKENKLYKKTHDYTFHYAYRQICLLDKILC